MPAHRRSWTESAGAISASSSAAVVNLDQRPDLPTWARIETAVVRNNSAAALTIVNAPGSPVVGPGERVEIPMGGSRAVRLQNDANAVASGDVLVTVEVEW